MISFPFTNNVRYRNRVNRISAPFCVDLKDDVQANNQGTERRERITKLHRLRLALSRHLSCRGYPLAKRNTFSIARLLRGSQLHSGNLLGTCLHRQTMPNARPSSHRRQMLSPKNGLASATCGHTHLVAL